MWRGAFILAAVVRAPILDISASYQVFLAISLKDEIHKIEFKKIMILNREDPIVEFRSIKPQSPILEIVPP